MKREHLTPFPSIAMLFVLLLVCDPGVALADRVAHYRVTIDNLTGQLYSPPVAVTHQGSLDLSQVGAAASVEPGGIAGDGKKNTGKVTQVIDVEAPLAPKKAATFKIMARSGDRLSLAPMVNCANGGITALNRARLPKRGAEIIWAAGYAAGTENNTELGADTVDPCSALGPVSLSGDPVGNENDAVNTTPPEQMQDRSNIQGAGDLTPADHAGTEPVAKITITHVADDAIKFLASLTGAGEVPPPVLATNAWGNAGFTLNDDMTELGYRLKALKIESGSTQAAIHRGLPDDNGPVVALLYGPASPAVDERLNISGRLTQTDLVGPLAGDFAGFVDALRAGELYINVHSNAYPAGEIRGQVGAR